MEIDIIWLYVFAGGLVALAVTVYITHRLTKPKELAPPPVPKKDDSKEVAIKHESKKLELLKGLNLNRKEKKKLNKQIKKHKDNLVVVFMETANGNYKTFIKDDSDGSFVWKKKTYVFDVGKIIDFSDLKMRGYFFQEQLDIPIVKRVKLEDKVLVFIDQLQKAIDDKFKSPISKKIDVTEVRKSIDAYGLAEVENAFDPLTLKRFIDTQVILQVMGGAWFTKIMKIVLIVCLVLLVFGLIQLAVTGWIAWEMYDNFVKTE